MDINEEFDLSQFMRDFERSKYAIPNILEFFKIYQPKFANATNTKELQDFDIFRTTFDLLCSIGTYIVKLDRTEYKQMELNMIIGKLEGYLKEYKHYSESYF
jgi:hypothetical protein